MITQFNPYAIKPSFPETFLSNKTTITAKAIQQKLTSSITNYMSRGSNQASDQFIV